MQRAANVDREAAAKALQDSSNRVPVAMVMLQAGVKLKVAEGALKKTSGHVRNAIAAARKR